MLGDSVIGCQSFIKRGFTMRVGCRGLLDELGTWAKAKAWCLLIHAETSLSLSFSRRVGHLVVGLTGRCTPPHRPAWSACAS
jgi:hypothetical protein